MPTNQDLEIYNQLRKDGDADPERELGTGGNGKGSTDSTRTSNRLKVLQRPSQDSVDENNGRLTSIEGFVYTIEQRQREQVQILTSIDSKMDNSILEDYQKQGVDIAKEIREQSIQAVKHLANIDTNTARLENIETHMKAVKNGIENMNRYGLIFKIMTGKIIIDTIDIQASYGLYVADYMGLVEFPPLKEVEVVDWPDEDGIEADLSSPILDTREFQMRFGGSLKANFGTLIALLSGGAYHTFVFEDLGITRVLRLVDNISYKGKKVMNNATLTFADDFPLDNYEYMAPNQSLVTGNEFG